MADGCTNNSWCGAHHRECPSPWTSRSALLAAARAPGHRALERVTAVPAVLRGVMNDIWHFQR
jgi:hypothetical protein